MYALQFAVVDDSKNDRQMLLQHIHTYMSTHQLEYLLHQYQSAEEFLWDIPNIEFDLVFMDIYMGDMSGIEAAQKLRTVNKDCKLVFLTTSDAHLRQALALSTSHYLNKPLKENEFLQAMDNCRIRPEFDVPTFQVQAGSMMITIDTTHVLYIDVDRHNTQIHTTSGVITANQSFSRVTESLLADRRFLQCMKGILINMDKVLRVENGCFLMKDHSLLPINMRSKKAMLETYQRYILRRMRGVL